MFGSVGRGEDVGMGRSTIAGSGVVVKMVSEVEGGKVVKGPKSDEENMKLHSLSDVEPV